MTTKTNHAEPATATQPAAITVEKIIFDETNKLNMKEKIEVLACIDRIKNKRGTGFSPELLKLQQARALGFSFVGSNRENRAISPDKRHGLGI